MTADGSSPPCPMVMGEGDTVHHTAGFAAVIFLWHQNQPCHQGRKCPLSGPCTQQENSGDGLWCGQPVAEGTDTPSPQAKSSDHVPYGVTTLQWFPWAECLVVPLEICLCINLV